MTVQNETRRLDAAIIGILVIIAVLWMAVQAKGQVRRC